MPTVAITRPCPGSLHAGAGVRVAEGPHEGLGSPGGLEAFVREHSPDVLVTMYHDRVDAKVIDAAGGRLKGVVNFAVGFENIDRAACAAKGVVVCNTPDAVTEGTADLAWALMLAAARRLPEADAYSRGDEYPKRGFLGMTEFLGVHFTGQTLLIVGAGRIGYAVAMRSLGWGMRVLYTARSRHLEFEFAPLAARRVALDDGLREADFVSVHTPMSPETRHLIDAKRLALMKPTSVLVNTARGAVVEEGALVDAVNAGRIWGAGLDVYEFEPKPGEALRACRRIAMTPHIGSASARHREMMTDMVGANVRAILAGETPPNIVRG